MYDHRIQILSNRALKLNKYVSPQTFKRGDFVCEKDKKTKDMGTNKNKVYFTVKRVKSPRCHYCVDTQDQCDRCILLPTNDVYLINLSTGHHTHRSANDITHIRLDQVLNPQFFLDLQEISNKSPEYISQDLVLSNKTSQPPDTYYQLRSRQKSGNVVIDANFALIKTSENQYKYKESPCQIVETVKKTCPTMK